MLPDVSLINKLPYFVMTDLSRTFSEDYKQYSDLIVASLIKLASEPVGTLFPRIPSERAPQTIHEIQAILRSARLCVLDPT
jgi:hypothetical protein